VLTRCSGQLRPFPNGVAVLGLDLAAAIALATALGYDVRSAAELLPAAEAGMVAAINRCLMPDG
jgi:hypothetical protein